MRRRKKVLSVVIILAFLLTLLPLGTAFAGDPVTIINSVNENVKRYDNGTPAQALGWIKLNIDSAYRMAGKIYVTIELPPGVKFETVADNTTKAGQYISFGGNPPSALTGTADESVLSVVYNDANVEYVLIRFSETGYGAKVFKNAASEIKVKVTAKAKDNAGTTIWSVGPVEKTVGLVGSGKVAVTAATPTSVSEGENKKAAKITLQETLPGDLSRDKTVEVKLTSTKYYQFARVDGKDVGQDIIGNYGLTVRLMSVASDKITLRVYGESTDFADKVSFTPVLTVLPGAPQGEISVTVSSPDDTDLETATLTIATVGKSDVTASVNDTSSDKLYVGSKTPKKIDEIVLKSSGTFSSGDTVVLTLPDGVKWAAAKGDALGDVEVAADPYNDGKSLWTKIATAANGKSEIKITGATVKVLPNATPGDLKVALSGTAGATGEVVVGQILARVNVSAVKAEIKMGGLKESAGDIVITETAKDSLSSSGKIKLSLPSGFKFAEKPKYAVNGGSATEFGSSGGSSVELNLADVALTGGIDTIIISNIKYEVDSRASGNVEVSIGGDALVEGYYLAEGDLGYDKDFAGKNVAKVVNAVVVSPTKRTAVFTLGSNVYTVNGVSYTMDVAAYEKDGRTYLPVRYVAYALGVDPANVLWDDGTQTVTLIKGTSAIQLTIGSKVLKLNGISITMDVAPELVSGRTMLPFRFIAQALGASVNWDPVTQTVTMDLE